MENEDYDNDFQIGLLVQQVSKLCKKPQIDSQLCDALNLFQEEVTRNETYLNNGVFNINFAEAALFLQCCSELYGKKIDLFWDQLLEFHTRLIEYDCRDEQEKGESVDADAIKKLEERRNRFKRKKKFKLALGEVNNAMEKFLFEKPSTDKNSIAFEADEDIYNVWRKFENQSADITRIPKAIYKQQARMYRLKNYYIMKSEDYDIYDPEDGEFNTKYSRIPGWHFIQHIFEYNTLGLLPDKNNTIATLRLCCYLRAQFMRDRNIPFNAPYSQYKDEYLEFKKIFFEEEAKKWQNMPLDTMADLHRQLEYLAQKEREENEKDLAKDSTKQYWNVPSFLNKKMCTCTIEDCSECSEDSKSTIITISDSLDKEFDISLLKEDLSKSEVYVCLDHLPKDVLDHKLRQDSGFFELDESGSIVNSTSEIETEKTGDILENTNEDIHTKNIDSTQVAIEGINNEMANPEDLSNTTEHPEESAKTKMNESSIINANEINDNISDTINPSECIYNNGISDENLQQQPVQNNDMDQSKENINPLENDGDDDNFDTRSILSDHDYCHSSKQINALTENNINEKNSKLTYDVMVHMSNKSRIIPKLMQAKENNIKQSSMGPPPPKRRKLSQKQIERLLTSKITPVNENKFEKFFSLNYQPQLGEGDIPAVDYESDCEQVTPDDILPHHSPLHDNDDARSIISDHSYCHLHSDDDHPNESGFIDEINDETLADNEGNEERTMESGTVEELPQRRREVDPEHEEEYQRLLAEIRESRKGCCEKLQIDPEREISERQKKEQERLAAKARVQQWRETINPILRDLKENDFDIHEYGSRVMEGMDVDETKLFKNIVDGRSSAEVVRYFIASLQLANTFNIEICGVKSGELSNDTFNVKLMRKDRYHEHLVEYHAPSENSFREKLKRIRDLQSKEETKNLEAPAIKRKCMDKKSYKNHKELKNGTPVTSRNFSTSNASAVMECQQSSISRSSKNTSNLPPNPIKGKNIVARLAHTFETTAPDTPSTSRSSIMFSPPTNSDHFCEELASAQQRNPEMFSTPQTQRQCRFIEPSMSNVQSFVFE